jgi:uncharacterized protein (UPF0264 family)
MKVGSCQVSSRPTQLLVSVRSAAEAEAALAGGADIIDVKEPTRGSLGMADAATIAEVVAAVGGRTPVSVALGEVVDNPVPPRLTGVTWAKAGLAGLQSEPHAAWYPLPWLNYHTTISPVGLVYVVYADAGRSRSVTCDTLLKWLCQPLIKPPAPPGIVLDTAIKDGRGLLHWYDVHTLRLFTLRCRYTGLFLALAGSLTLGDVKLLMDEVRPDIIAVRGAACEQGVRESRVCAEAVAALKQVIRAGSPV